MLHLNIINFYNISMKYLKEDILDDQVFKNFLDNKNIN